MTTTLSEAAPEQAVALSPELREQVKALALMVEATHPHLSMAVVFHANDGQQGLPLVLAGTDMAALAHQVEDVGEILVDRFDPCDCPTCRARRGVQDVRA